ncbi:cytochrome P450 [Tanacetum coccineum]
MNILLGGTDTSAATVVWAMMLLIKNPESLKRLQQEVRNVIGNKGKVHEDDLDKLKYLKAGETPNCWERPEEFEPERFMGSGSSIDYKGTDFELIPFGSGRRICPGISMTAVTMEMTLLNLINSFDWESPAGAQEIDTSKSPGAVTHKKNAF